MSKSKLDWLAVVAALAVGAAGVAWADDSSAAGSTDQTPSAAGTSSATSATPKAPASTSNAPKGLTGTPTAPSPAGAVVASPPPNSGEPMVTMPTQPPTESGLKVDTVNPRERVRAV